METDPNATGVESGQEVPSVTEGHSSESTETEGHATLAPTENYEDRYKELQSTYTKETQANKELKETLAQFDNFGGHESLLKTAEFLQNSDSFAEWMKNEQTQEQHQRFGIDTQDLDSDSIQAMDLVEKMATEIAGKEIEKFKQEFQGKLDPIEQERAEQNLASIEAQMDDTHPEWREFKDQMFELSKDLPEAMTSDPDVNLVTSLYYQALASNPEKYSAVMAKAHSDKIEKAKSKSMTSPSGTHKGSTGQANSVMEAFRMTQGN